MTDAAASSPTAEGDKTTAQSLLQQIERLFKEQEDDDNLSAPYEEDLLSLCDSLDLKKYGSLKKLIDPDDEKEVEDHFDIPKTIIVFDSRYEHDVSINSSYNGIRDSLTLRKYDSVKSIDLGDGEVDDIDIRLMKEKEGENSKVDDWAWKAFDSRWERNERQSPLPLRRRSGVRRGRKDT